MVRHDVKLGRRGFVGLCASAAAAVAAHPEALAGPYSVAQLYRRVRLVGEDDAPLAAAALEVGETYVFHYPYRTTPCFLIDLGNPTPPPGPLSTEDGRAYRWPGGVGPGRSIVSFAAICAHKMSHPAKSVSFIDYRHEPVRYLDRNREPRQGGGVIYCCSERSVYDPARGAAVLGGPATQPLAAILLEHDPETGGLTALGTLGGELYEAFFRTFGHRLQLEYGTSQVREPAAGTTRVVPLARFSAVRTSCGA